MSFLCGLGILIRKSPYDTAGSEIYTYYLAFELAKGEEIYAFYRIADRNMREYEITSSIFDDLNVYSINNTLKYRHSFEGTYKKDIIAAGFGSVLDEIKPDVVHFGQRWIRW